MPLFMLDNISFPSTKAACNFSRGGKLLRLCFSQNNKIYS